MYYTKKNCKLFTSKAVISCWSLGPHMLFHFAFLICKVYWRFIFVHVAVSCLLDKTDACLPIFQRKLLPFNVFVSCADLNGQLGHRLCNTGSDVTFGDFCIV